MLFHRRHGRGNGSIIGDVDLLGQGALDPSRGGLGLRPIEVGDADRAAYHAAASIAANFLVTLQAAAERLASTTGVDREALAPLARAALENWAALGGERALTGPIARGDEATVERQRAAVAERCPELLAAWDALAALTRDLANRGVPALRAVTLA